MSNLPQRLHSRKFQFLDKLKQSAPQHLRSSDTEWEEALTPREEGGRSGGREGLPPVEAPQRSQVCSPITPPLTPQPFIIDDPVARVYEDEVEEDNHHTRRETMGPIIVETIDESASEGGISHRMSKSESNADDVRSQLSFIMKDRLHNLVKEVQRRTSVVRATIVEDDPFDVVSVATAEDQRRASLSQLIGMNAPTAEQAEADKKTRFTINPLGTANLLWLTVQTLAFLYNAFAVPLRSTYPYQTAENLAYWMGADYFCDVLYVLDIVVWKPRMQFMAGGIPITSIKETSVVYFRSVEFKIDLLSILPTDVLYLQFGPTSIIRSNRLIHFTPFLQFFDTLDNTFSNPYAIRIARTLFYMVYIIHLNSCVYYLLSAKQAFGQIAYNYNGKWYINKWVYNNQGNAYIRCFYFTAAVATSTGNNPPPTNVIEYIYMTISWMMGVFVFALLLGQIRDIVSNANRNKEDFRRQLDNAIMECRRLNVPKSLTERVRSWFIYTWEQHRTLDENKQIERLPLKLQTDLALSVHYSTLSKVQLFKDCERALLRDLVLKLRPVIFQPGDMICQKGDVGKEMYIVNLGVLEVVGGENNEKVFTTLHEGSVFGEISLLSIGGNNRRTASIRAKGFATLFVLAKDDLQDVIKYYPQAQVLLKRKAAEMLKKDKKVEPEASRTRLEEACRLSVVSTPKMLQVVAQTADKEGMGEKGSFVQLKKALEEKPVRRASTFQWPLQDGMSDISEDEFSHHSHEQ